MELSSAVNRRKHTTEQQSFDIPFPTPFPNLKRSFPRDFIQPDDRKRPLVQTGTGNRLEKFPSPRRISRSSLPRTHSRLDHPFHTNFLSRFPIQLHGSTSLPITFLPSILLRTTSFLSLSVRLESTRKKENGGKLSSFRLISLLSGEFPYFYPRISPDYSFLATDPVSSPARIEVERRIPETAATMLPVLIPVDGVVGSRSTRSKGLRGK